MTIEPMSDADLDRIEYLAKWNQNTSPWVPTLIAEVRRRRARLVDKDREITGLVNALYEAKRHGAALAAWMREAIENADYGGAHKALAEYDKWLNDRPLP